MIYEHIPEEMRINPEEKEFYISLGKKIKLARDRLGLSSATVAAAIGVNVDQLEKYENAVLAILVYHFITLLQYMKFAKELENLK